MSAQSLEYLGLVEVLLEILKCEQVAVVLVHYSEEVFVALM